MKFAFTLFALSLSPAFANTAPVTAPVCTENKAVVAPAPSLEGLLQAMVPFCTGACERDFDCMPGCSCHMSGRCM